mgnify:CR=1 FL=1
MGLAVLVGLKGLQLWVGMTMSSKNEKSAVILGFCYFLTTADIVSAFLKLLFLGIGGTFIISISFFSPIFYSFFYSFFSLLLTLISSKVILGCTHNYLTYLSFTYRIKESMLLF